MPRGIGRLGPGRICILVGQVAMSIRLRCSIPLICVCQRDGGARLVSAPPFRAEVWRVRRMLRVEQREGPGKNIQALEGCQRGSNDKFRLGNAVS
jgi:hypothetical protein